MAETFWYLGRKVKLATVWNKETPPSQASWCCCFHPQIFCSDCSMVVENQLLELFSVLHTLFMEY